MWRETPFGAFADVMLETPGNHRTLTHLTASSPQVWSTPERYPQTVTTRGSMRSFVRRLQV
jgi:hypothetical protein